MIPIEVDIYNDQHLHEALSFSGIPLENRPTAEDWLIAQGGMPRVVMIAPNLYNVIHDYVNVTDSLGTGAVVTTSIAELNSWGSTNLRVFAMINGRKIVFPSALLWQIHGRPCESTSQTRYRRVAVLGKP